MEGALFVWPPQTYPRPSRLPPPAVVDVRLRGGIGPLGPAPAHPCFPLRGRMVYRLRGGIGPLGPAPAHPCFPLRSRMVYRLRGGIHVYVYESLVAGDWLRVTNHSHPATVPHLPSRICDLRKRGQRLKMFRKKNLLLSRGRA